MTTKKTTDQKQTTDEEQLIAEAKATPHHPGQNVTQLHHPNIRGITATVNQDAAAQWEAAGWGKNPTN